MECIFIWLAVTRSLGGMAFFIPPLVDTGWDALLVCRSETIRCEWIFSQWVRIRSFAHPNSDLCLVLSVCIYVTWEGGPT